MTETATHTAESLSTMKTVELRKFASQAFGVQKIDRDGVQVSVFHGRKNELITEILRQQEFRATFVSAEGRKNPNRHPVYGWPIAGEQAAKFDICDCGVKIEIGAVRCEGCQKAEDPKPVDDKAVRTSKGVKGKLCAGCGRKPVDRKTQGRDSILCTECFEKGSLENEHADGLHDVAPAAGCPECAPAPAANGVSPKAVRFERDAKAAGWTALVSTQPGGLSCVSATSQDGSKAIELRWLDGVYQYDLSSYSQTGRRALKVRNASAARKLLASV